MLGGFWGQFASAGMGGKANLLGGAAKAAYGGLNPLAKSIVGGAGIGGGIGAAYGAFGGNDTSVLGGAMKGAALGAVGGLGTRAFGAGAIGYRGMGFAMGTSGGRGAGKAIAGQMRHDARQAGQFIGNTARRAVNGFSAMGRNAKAFGKAYWNE